MKIPRINLVGKRYGRLCVVSLSPVRQGKAYMWECVCDCGNATSVKVWHLNAGRVKSCGCLSREMTAVRSTTHGGTKLPEYRSWTCMKDRCCDPENNQFSNYGGRGIKVCDRWKGSFSNFLSDMGSKPTGMHSIDRIDVNGNYEPGNCRWATPKEQSRGSRRTPRILSEHLAKEIRRIRSETGFGCRRISKIIGLESHARAVANVIYGRAWV
jgi:hypothetical protein